MNPRDTISSVKHDLMFQGFFVKREQCIFVKSSEPGTDMITLIFKKEILRKKKKKIIYGPA